MSGLPIDRDMNNLQPFKNTGIDYFGAFEVKMFRRTVQKWVCLFTCLVVLELVDTLDTTSCLDAVHRFIARRGQPKTIISDNGTNFVGAAREFKECFAELQRDGIKVRTLLVGHQMGFQSTSSASLRWSLGKIGTILQKSSG